jgi:endonuclease/exonuclease/phosphatase family metal-dependent hydrolase
MTGHPGIVVRALTWNLFHGRDFPPDPALLTWRSRLLRRTEVGDEHAQVNRPLLAEFAAVLEGADWDLALLQEAPPRWLRALGGRLGAGGALALTSRNALPWLRACVADWNPDLIASNEGGSNQVLLRAPWRLAAVERVLLTRRPERRVLLLVGARHPAGPELCVGCVHASRGALPAARDVDRAAGAAVEWAGDRPLVLGGDFNVRPEEDRSLYERLRAEHGFTAPLERSIDQLLGRGLAATVAPTAWPAPDREVLEREGRRVRLSDHAPVAGSFGMR